VPLKNTAGRQAGRQAAQKNVPLKNSAGDPHINHAAEEHSRRAGRRAGDQMIKKPFIE
jgi:hypothetical protein